MTCSHVAALKGLSLPVNVNGPSNMANNLLKRVLEQYLCDLLPTRRQNMIASAAPGPALFLVQPWLFLATFMFGCRTNITGYSMLTTLLSVLLPCSHSKTTFPMTPRRKAGTSNARATYVVCLECGREFEYDWHEMRIRKAAPVTPRIQQHVPGMKENPLRTA